MLGIRLWYLSGPMTGLPDFNFPAFERAALELRRRGVSVLSAHEIDHGETLEERGSQNFETYLKTDLRKMLECDGVILLPGWKTSRGARLEHSVAKTLWMEIREYSKISAQWEELIHVLGD